MPTAQARTTQARRLHASRSSIRSANDTSSLSERRIARRFFLFRWHRAHTCHALKCQDSDLQRPMAWFPGAHVLRTMSWAHVRVWGAAGRGCHTLVWPGSARFARSSYVNRALFGISTADKAQRCRARVARAKAPKRPASTAHLASSASGCPRPGRRDRALGAATERCASTTFEGHQQAPKEGPLSKDSRFRSEVERHRLNEKGTSEVASGALPAALTHDDGRALADARERGSRRTQDLRHS